MGDTICMFALDFFAFGTLPVGLNDNLLILIPKVQNQELISQLRPISLCNVGYKIIIKTIANRLKDIMAQVVVPNQLQLCPRPTYSGYIMSSSTRKSSTPCEREVGKGMMTLKIELEKAYDHLSWVIGASLLYKIVRLCEQVQASHQVI